MIVAQHVAAGGAAAPVTGTWPIVAPAGQAPARVYRRTLRLRLPTGGAADGLRIDPAGTVLGGAFGLLDYDARHPPHPGLAVSLTSSGGDAVAALDAPREVRRVRLPATRGAAVVELHRLDGNRRVDKATASGAAGSTLAGFTDRRFAIRVAGAALAPAEIDELHVRSYPTGPRIGLAPPGVPGSATFFWRTTGELGRPAPAGDPATGPPLSAGAVTAGTALAAELQRYVDGLAAPLPAQLEVDLVLESDAPCSLAVASFAVAYRLVSRSFAGPQLGAGDLVDADALAGALHRRADPVSRHLAARLGPEGRRVAERGGDAALATELSALVAGPALYDAEAFAGAALTPATRTLAEAGATGAELARLNRALLEEAYPGTIAARDAKRTLRFPGGRAETRELAVLLPAGATVAAGELRTTEGLRGDRAAAGADELTGALGQTSGVRLGADAAAAAASEQPEPLAATGVAVALLATTERAELLAELRADHEGAPTGRKLAEAPLLLEGAGTRAWATVAFPAPVALPAGRHWIVLRAAGGSAVWLADENGGGAGILEPATGAVRSALPGIAPLHRLLARSAELATRPGVALEVGPVTVAPETGDDGEPVYPLAAALGAALEGAPGGAPVAVPLRFTAAVAGTVTVHPPELEYEL